MLSIIKLSLLNLHLYILEVRMLQGFGCSDALLGQIGEHFKQEIYEVSVGFNHFEHLSEICGFKTAESFEHLGLK